MKLLVCGAAGFIGSTFVGLRVTEHGDEVTVFDALTYAGREENLRDLGDRVSLIQGRIEDPEAVAAALEQTGAEAIVNFAAETHVDRSIADPFAFSVTNGMGTHVLLEAARERGLRYVQVSTDEVYGSIEHGSWTEDHVLEPNSPYSASKAGADLIARSYAVTYGLDVRITRCSNNYGPYHFPEKFIPLFVTNLLDGIEAPLYGVGANVRDWLWVGDHCAALALVLEKGHGGEIYNVGGGRELSNRALAELLIEATGRDWSLVREINDPRGAGHDLRYSVDFGKVAGLGYQPRMTFEDGLARTVQWYRDNRAWWEPLRERAAL
jgi:dTDP-glucose 4,6-dehydratase